MPCHESKGKEDAQHGEMMNSDEGRRHEMKHVEDHHGEMKKQDEDHHGEMKKHDKSRHGEMGKQDEDHRGEMKEQDEDHHGKMKKHGKPRHGEVKKHDKSRHGEVKTHEKKWHSLSDVVPLFTAKFNSIIPHRYIVVFKKDIPLEEIDFHKEVVEQAQLQSVSELPENDPFFASTSDLEFSDSLAGGVRESFDIAGMLNGYVGYFTEGVVDLIRKSPLVEFVEEDSLVHTTDFDTQNGAPWGLSRISHRERLNLGSFNKYLFDDQGGEGVTSYVIDTGINVKHKDFDGRAVWGKTIPVNDEDLDGNGHGTHCAGTIASKHYGVAKQAEVVAVKVLRSNGSGSMSDVIKGVEYAAQSHQKAVKDNKKGFKGSTANMSLGGGKSPALDLAVNAAVKAGIHFAVAAGNENQDACSTSPAAAEGPITVGASTLSDDRAYFSNWGSCVDIFAPGLNILSTYIGSEDATATLSGTSMASPHVAGLLTYLLSLQPGYDSAFSTSGSDSISPEQMKKKLIAYSTQDVLADLPSDTPNALIYNGGGQDLSDFWGGKSKKADERAKGMNLQDFAERVGSKTDELFDEIRDVMDRLNII